MKLTKTQLKKIIKEELETSWNAQEIRQKQLGHIRGSKANQFTQAVIDISTTLYRIMEPVDSGMGWDDSGEDLEQSREDYDNWHDHLGKVKEDPVYRKAAKSLIGMEVKTKQGTGTIIDVELKGHGWTAESATELKFFEPGKWRKGIDPFNIEVSDLGIPVDGKRIIEVN